MLPVRRLIPIVAVTCLLGLAGFLLFKADVQPSSGTYLILSRTARTHEADGGGTEACTVAAYRWNPEAKDAPALLGTTTSQGDCYGGFDVVGNDLYKFEYVDGQGTYTKLNLSGKQLSTSSERPMLKPEQALSPAGIRMELVGNIQTGTSAPLRVWEADGTLLREKIFTDKEIPPIGYLSICGEDDEASKAYLCTWVEIDGYRGPWPMYAYDWKNDEVNEVPAVRQLGAGYGGSFAFDASGKKLLVLQSVMKDDPEGHGWTTDTPSSVHLIGLADGSDTVLRNAPPHEPFTGIRFSPNGNLYLATTLGFSELYDLRRESPSQDRVSSPVVDWFGDTLVLDLQGETSIKSLRTGAVVTPSDHFAPFQYVGRVSAPAK